MSARVDLTGTRWRLVELDGHAPQDTADPVEITFGDDGRVNGSTGVNRLNAGYRVQGDVVEFTPAATTRMAGPPAAMGQEQAVLRVLAGRQPFSVDGDQLVLGGARFVAVAEAAGDSVTVSGSVLYRERIALPDGAVVIVRVLDVSLADAPSVTVAEQRIEPEHQVPIPFSIDVPRTRLEPRHTYSVSARIEVDGELAWVSDTHHPVATEAPTNADILVVKARG
jgi:putative lipoprotein